MSLPIWIDPSNSNLNFTRNRVRKEILPVLESLYPGSSIRISNLSESLSDLNNTQNELTSLSIEALYLEKGLSREKITKLSLSTRATVFHKWIKDNNGPMISSIKLIELSLKVSIGNPPGLIQI